MKERFFWAGFAVVIFSWIGNYFYFQDRQIEIPIFLEHYTEKELQPEVRLTFYYITNLSDTREINYATVDGGVEMYPQSGFHHFFWSDGQPHVEFHQRFTHQGIRQVHFDVHEHFIEEAKDSDGKWSFSEMTVYFDDGTSTTQSIGEVIIRERDMTDPEIGVVDSRYSSGGSDGSSETGSTFLKDANITEVVIPFSSPIAEETSIKIRAGEEEIQWQHSEKNWKHQKKQSDDIFPIKVKQGDSLNVYIQDNSDHHPVLDFPLKIVGESTDGIPFTSRAYVGRIPYLSYETVKEVMAGFEGSGE